MAGNVTGNLGNENITLRNMATEDTLEEILRVLSNDKKIVPKDTNDNNSATNRNTKEKEKNSSATRAGTKSFGEFITQFGSGVIKVVRSLDSEINNIGSAFSHMARGQGFLSENLKFAAESVTQLQEQFNAYSKMMQVGGAVTGDFIDLRNQASGLGTDLTGLTRITEQYSLSLKVGSTFVKGGLKKLGEAFNEISGDSGMIAEFGRLGVLPQQISEQLMLAAEAQGGFGDVMKRYGGDVGMFGKGMLKTTQELNVFASAVGTNSRMMQDEMAKAQQKITNRVLMATLTDAQKKQVMAISGMTGNAEEAMQVMRSMTGGITSKIAGLFQSTQDTAANLLGAGSKFTDFMDMVGSGTDEVEALTKSGLLKFAQGLNDFDLRKVGDQIAAYEEAGQADQARFLSQQLTWLKALKDSNPGEIGDKLKDLRSGATDASKSLDGFTKLQNEQVKLARSTATLNTQINKLGLAMAIGIMKPMNLALEGAGKASGKTKEYIESYIRSAYGIDTKIPDNVLDGPIDKIIEWADALVSVNFTPDASKEVKTGLQTAAGSMLVKMLDGTVKSMKVDDLINNEKIRKTTEAFKGENNKAGTMIMGSMLQRNVKYLGAVTAGDDADPIHSRAGAHPKGQALDFAVNAKGTDPELAHKLAAKEVTDYLMKQYGLKKEDFSVLNEYNAKGGSHIHVEFKDPKFLDKVRNDSISALSQTQQTEKDKKTGEVDRTTTQQQSTTTQQNSQQVGVGSVNSNVAVVSIAKPEWFEDAMKNSSTQQSRMMSDLGNKFDNMYSLLKKKLG